MQLKISDMMDHLLPEDEVNEPMPQPDVDKSRIKALVKDGLSPSAAPLKRNRRPKRRPVSLAAAAAVLLLCTAFAAAHYFEWDDALLKFLSPTAQQTTDLSPAGLTLGQSQTSGEVTVTLNQVLGDKYGVYILLDVEGPADAVYDDSYSFSDNWLNITDASGQHFGMGYSYTAIADAERPNHFSLIFDINASESLIGAQAQLELADLRRYSISDGDYLPVAEGSWKFNWTLNYEDLSQTRAIDAPFALYADSDRLTELTISPLSLTLIAKGDGIAAFDREPDFDLPDAGSYLLEQITFLQKDGTVIPLPAPSYGSSTQDDAITITYTFGEVIDLANLQSIKIGSEIYPLK